MRGLRHGASTPRCISRGPGRQPVDGRGPGGAPARGEQSLLPTFVRAVPRERPSARTAGLADCDPSASRCWEADAFRFPPYQYTFENCLARPAFEEGEVEWRHADSVERELLLRFKHNHTLPCVKAAVAASPSREFDGQRISVPGNSFHVGVMAWTIGWLRLEWKLISFPPEAALLGAGPLVPAAPLSHNSPGELAGEPARRQLHRGRQLRHVSVSMPTAGPPHINYSK